MSAHSRFPLGHVVTTPGALVAFEKTGQSPSEFLQRHQHVDWGDLCPDDAKANELALIDGSRLLSSYHLNDDTKVWIITEADRSITCILLPSEY